MLRIDLAYGTEFFEISEPPSGAFVVPSASLAIGANYRPDEASLVSSLTKRGLIACRGVLGFHAVTRLLNLLEIEAA